MEKRGGKGGNVGPAPISSLSWTDVQYNNRGFCAELPFPFFIHHPRSGHEQLIVVARRPGEHIIAAMLSRK